MSGRRFASLARLLSLTAEPASPGEADLWYRSDLDQVHAHDGTGRLTVGPFGNVPVVRSGAWHTLPPAGAPSSANFPADRLFAIPFYPGRSCTVQALAVNVTLALVGGNIRMGLYSASAAGVPDALVADYGTVTVGLTGIRSIAGLSTAVRPVLSFLAVARQGGLLNLGLSSRDTWDQFVSDSSAVLAESRNTYYRDTVAGALPASFGAVAGTIQGPSVAVQLG